MRWRSLWPLVVLLSGCPSEAPLDGGRDVGRDAPVDAGSPDARALDAPSDSGDDDAPDAEGRSRIDEIVALLEASPVDATAIDAALHEVAWAEGWPLYEPSGTAGHPEGRWLFATTLSDGPTDVHFVSDVNDWSPTAHPAQRAESAVHHWVVLDDTELTRPPEGARYKWLVGGDDYRAPRDATAYGYDENGRFGWVRPDPLLSHLEQFPAMVSSHLELPRTLRAYLPAGFVPGSSAAASMRTLLLHDGQNVFGPEAPLGGWGVDVRLGDVGLGDAPYRDVVALSIDNAADRMDAYTHVVDTVAGGPTGGRADDYLALVFDEVLPFFRGRYGVAATGDSLAVMGSSLGGLVTLVAAMREPPGFGCGAAMSPTLGWGSFASGAMASLITRWPTEVGHGEVALYLDSGGGGPCLDADGDGVNDDGSGTDNYCETAQLREVLDGLGYDFGVDLVHWHEPGASHDEAAWAARVVRALDACTDMGWTAP